MKMSGRVVIGAALGGALMLSCCGKSAPNEQAGAPAGGAAQDAGGAAAPAERAATPNLDRVIALHKALSTDATMAIGSVRSNAAGLKVDDFGGMTADRVRAQLNALQPTVEAAMEVAAGELEPMPPMQLGADPASHEMALWHGVTWMVRLLSADASRCADAGADRAAVQRLIASLTYGGHFVEGPSEAHFYRGIPLVMMTAQQVQAMLDADLLDPSPADRERLAAAFEAAAPDPDRFIEVWRQGAVERLAEAQKDYRGTGGIDRLAEDISTGGVDESGMRDVFARQSDRRVVETMVFRREPDEVRALGTTRVEMALEAAEALIPRVEAALASNDLEAAFRSIHGTLAADETQITKLVVAAGPGLYMKLLRECRDAALEVARRLRAG